MLLYASERLPAYDLLTMAAKEVWDWPALPELARTDTGKPWFPQAPEHHFNLSHSRGLALCALDSAPVGADIQVIKPSWREGLPRRVCSEAESAWLDLQPHRWSAFTQLWALKEAQVKYTGVGLQGAFRTIPIPLPREGQTLYQIGSQWFRIYEGPDWRGAVCGETPPPESIQWR